MQSTNIEYENGSTRIGVRSTIYPLRVRYVFYEVREYPPEYDCLKYDGKYDERESLCSKSPKIRFSGRLFINRYYKTLFDIIQIPIDIIDIIYIALFIVLFIVPFTVLFIVLFIAPKINT